MTVHYAVLLLREVTPLLATPCPARHPLVRYALPPLLRLLASCGSGCGVEAVEKVTKMPFGAHVGELDVLRHDAVKCTTWSSQCRHTEMVHRTMGQNQPERSGRRGTRRRLAVSCEHVMLQQGIEVRVRIKVVALCVSIEPPEALGAHHRHRRGDFQ